MPKVAEVAMLSSDNEGPATPEVRRKSKSGGKKDKASGGEGDGSELKKKKKKKKSSTTEEGGDGDAGEKKKVRFPPCHYLQLKTEQIAVIDDSSTTLLYVQGGVCTVFCEVFISPADNA